MIEELLAEAGLSREEIEGLAVGIGPGSYTGIRLAIAIAQGWHLADRLPVFAISSLEAMAVQASILGWHGEAGLVIEAGSRDLVYLDRYRMGPGGIKNIGEVMMVPRTSISGLSADFLAGPDAVAMDKRGRELFPEAEAVGQLALQGGKEISPEKLEPLCLQPPAYVKAPLPRVFGDVTRES